MSTITVDIERIVLSDLDVTPARAERIRAMIELELQHLLERQGLPAERGVNIANMSTPALHLTEIQNDLHVARSLAQSITQALRGIR